MQVNGREINIVNSKRKSIALVVLPTGEIEVRAPRFIPKFLITQFVNSKEEWIQERIEKISKTKTLKKKFINGEKFLFLGKEYSLQLSTNPKIELIDDELLFPLALATRGKETLEKWYVKQAKEIITKQVEFYSEKMDAHYQKISFSDTSSKWGSCTHDNRLQFNWRLVMAPLLVLRYVVIHELVHTTEKNHASTFWSKVREQNPSYKQQMKWLKDHGSLLHFTT